MMDNLSDYILYTISILEPTFTVGNNIIYSYIFSLS